MLGLNCLTSKFSWSDSLAEGPRFLAGVDHLGIGRTGRWFCVGGGGFLMRRVPLEVWVGLHEGILILSNTEQRYYTNKEKEDKSIHNG